jgi:hypothetical protein
MFLLFGSDWNLTIGLCIATLSSLLNDIIYNSVPLFCCSEYGYSIYFYCSRENSFTVYLRGRVSKQVTNRCKTLNIQGAAA